MADSSIESLLLRAKELSSDKIEMLESLLVKEKLSALKTTLKDLRIRLTGATRKQDIIEHLMCMAHIGAVQEEDADSDDACAISYLTDEMKRDIQELPSFCSITSWTKNLSGVLVEFTFMNLLIYLVYGRDKTFDMQSMKAFRSLKAYKFFFDGFVRNVWVFECPRISNLNLRVLYFRAYVHHSLTCDSPLEVYISINGDNGDVYSGKCSCVSG